LATTTSPHTRPWAWVALGGFLLTWNMLAALYANPLLMTQRWDGPQYQLLARNRLHGHYEMRDTANTVRSEGQHPMFRPGLVWIEEALAPWLGSVRTASALASVLATSLMEWLMLWLAWRCFGRLAFVLALLCVVAPLWISVQFLLLAVGQGVEPWAAATLLLGLAILVEAVRQGSWRWAVMAGAAAGLAEWFRTGNHPLFAVPCVVYAVTALWQRQRRGLLVAATALAGFLVVVGLSGLYGRTPVQKTVANLWHRLVEHEGRQYAESCPYRGSIVMYLNCMKMGPGGEENYYDYITKHSREHTTLEFVREHGSDIFALYLRSLQEVVEGGAWGLRFIIGDLVFFFFVLQVLISLCRRKGADLHCLAFAGAALAQYLGPIVLFRGDDPSNYHLVPLPLFIIVAAYGGSEVVSFIVGWFARRQPVLTGHLSKFGRPALVVVMVPLACLCASYYAGALDYMKQSFHQAEEQQAAIDRLGLEGCRAACRDVSWFIDRDVEMVSLPYATVPELERYVRQQGIDGILIWDNAPEVVCRANPYGSLDKFLSAMGKSRVFGPVKVSGEWHWYPVRADASPAGRSDTRNYTGRPQ